MAAEATGKPPESCSTTADEDCGIESSAADAVVVVGAVAAAVVVVFEIS